jgi:hypothetical protein
VEKIYKNPFNSNISTNTFLLIKISLLAMTDYKSHSFSKKEVEAIFKRLNPPKSNTEDRIPYAAIERVAKEVEDIEPEVLENVVSSYLKEDTAKKQRKKDLKKKIIKYGTIGGLIAGGLGAVGTQIYSCVTEPVDLIYATVTKKVKGCSKNDMVLILETTTENNIDYIVKSQCYGYNGSWEISKVIDQGTRIAFPSEDLEEFPFARVDGDDLIVMSYEHEKTGEAVDPQTLVTAIEAFAELVK